jgi:hypothetical protein
LVNTHDVELYHRIQQGWQQFFANKRELCGKHVRWTSRLKLFNAMVTPTVLYGSGSWTMTAERQRKLKTTQRRMLRMMFGARWRGAETEPMREERSVGESTADTDETLGVDAMPEESESDEDDEEDEQAETWVEWMKRVTGLLEDQVRKAGVEDWVLGQRRRKWRWAGHLARRDDERWSSKIVTWIPEGGTRRVGRPERRWGDDLDNVLPDMKGIWMALAQDRDEWHRLEDVYVAQH